MIVHTVITNVVFVWVLPGLWNALVITPLMYRINCAMRGDGFLMMCFLIPPAAALFGAGTVMAKVYGNPIDRVTNFYNHLVDNLSK